MRHDRRARALFECAQSGDPGLRDLLRPPVNVLRLSLHPEGLAPRIENFGQWRGHVLTRLARQVDVSGDPVLTSLHAELKALPVPGSSGLEANLAGGHADVVVPLRLRTDAGLLSFFSTTTVFGTAVDVTLSELAIESFFPADARTGELLRSLASGG